MPFPILLAAMLIQLDGGPEEQAEWLIEMHRQTMERIRTLTVDLCLDVSEDGGQTWTRQGQVLWRKDGARHRFTCMRFGKASEYRHLGLAMHRDCYFDPEECREFNMPVPDPQPSGWLESIVGPTFGRIGDSRKALGGEGPPAWLFHYVDDASMLPDFSGKDREKRFLGCTTEDGVELWGIQVVDDRRGMRYDLYLDPAQRFTVVRRDVRDRQSGEIVSVHRVLESEEIKPGLFLPMRVRNSSVIRPSKILEIRVLSAEINEPLPTDAFDFRFPPGCVVAREQKSRREIYIWGENGPAWTFADSEGFQRWLFLQLAWKLVRPAAPFLVLALAILACLSVRWALRRRRRSTGPREAPELAGNSPGAARSS